MSKHSSDYPKLAQKYDLEERLLFFFFSGFEIILQYMYINIPQLLWEWIGTHF